MAFFIEHQGNCLVMNINGDRLMFYPTGHGVWLHNAEGALQISELGNQLLIGTGVSKLIAYPTGHGQWLCTGDFEPGPDPEPGEGEFSWPYEPAPGHWVTSEYGPRSGRFHEGMDFSGGPAVYGEPIPAIGDGTVVQSGLNGAFGYSVILNHGTIEGWEYRSLYAHMPSTPPVSVGATVDKADIIGYVNNTGSSFGSHLHMEIHKLSPGSGMVWDNLNPSFSSPRTAINPRHFFTALGDGLWILS